MGVMGRRKGRTGSDQRKSYAGSTNRESLAKGISHPLAAQNELARKSR